MTSNKTGMNFVFACIVILLAVTAAASLYRNYRLEANRSGAASKASSDQPQQNQSLEDEQKRLAQFKQLLDSDPQNSYYLTQIGNVYYDMGQYDHAIEFYTRSLTLRPQDPNVETDLGTCYHYLNQDDKALEIFDKVLKYNPGFPQAMFNKGIVLIEGKHNVKEGIAVWEDLLRSRPDYPHKAELEQRINQLKGSAN